MEPELRHLPKTDFEKHRIVRSDGEVTIDGVYPEREKGFYMLRLRVPGGVLTLDQADALADFAHDYSGGEWHVDTRANIEFHAVPEARLLEFVEKVETIGLTTRGACGDSVRNIVLGSESTGPALDRIQQVVEAATRRFAGKPEFEVLPRKFKIAFYAADDREPLHRINDLGFVQESDAGVPLAAGAHAHADGTPALLHFSVWIGGGLGREPRLGDLAFARVPETEVGNLIEAAVLVHNQWGNRKNRARARLKYVLEDLGLAKVRELILQRWAAPTGVDLSPVASPARPAPRLSADGVHAQHDGRFRVRVPLVAGDITGRGVRPVLAAARRAGATRIQLSARQNIAIPDVPAAAVAPLVRELETLGYPPSGWFGARDIVACPGASSCRKGFVETHDFARVLSDALVAAPAPDWARRLRISVSGCPNSCSQPQLYDLGFRGNAGKARGAVVKGYDLLIGGRLYGRTLIGQQFASLLSQQDVVAVATAAVKLIGETGRDGEAFDALVDRVGLLPFARQLQARVTLQQGEWANVLTPFAGAAPRTNAEAAALSAELEKLPPREILRWAVEVFGDRLLVSTALNAGGVLLLQYLHEIAPGHRAYFMDTGKLFAETLAYRDLLRDRFGLNIVTVGPDFTETEFAATYGAGLWRRDPNLCCNIRKVQVMNRLRHGKAAWVSALRREQGGERAAVNVLELEPDGVVKIQPLALATRADIDRELGVYGIPQHPLLARGFRSIGCEPCTVPVAEGQGERAGRWAGTGKTECGLHSPRRAAARLTGAQP
ncbi:MAG: phosphoadenylyl-sulfate reductase [Planctomycetes bacterium]|nr:phosphoadenylyl-sulfate reductase [Planctomycetota bacterium]